MNGQASLELWMRHESMHAAMQWNTRSSFGNPCRGGGVGAEPRMALMWLRQCSRHIPETEDNLEVFKRSQKHPTINSRDILIIIANDFNYIIFVKLTHIFHCGNSKK